MSWRDHIKVHPAADLFPLMSEAELRKTGENIKKSGLTIPIVLWRNPSKSGSRREHYSLLDGRNRLDAMELVGIEFVLFFHPDRKYWTLETKGGGIYEVETTSRDPYDFVFSTNVCRRDLTPEVKRDLIAKLLKADPSDEIGRRLQQSIEKDEEDGRTTEVEDVLRHDLSSMPKEQVGGALIAIVGLGGPLGRRMSMAAMRTEEGKAAALAWLALEQKTEVIRAVQGEAAAQEWFRHEIDTALSRKPGRGTGQAPAPEDLD
jgi:hypothetical protein